MRLPTLLTVATIWGTPVMADEIDRLSRFSVKEVMASYSSRWPVMEAAGKRYKLSPDQVTEFGACMRMVARDLELQSMPLTLAAPQCAEVAKKAK